MVALPSTSLCVNGIAGSFISQAGTICDSCAAYAIDLVGLFEPEVELLA